MTPPSEKDSKRKLPPKPPDLPPPPIFGDLLGPRKSSSSSSSSQKASTEQDSREKAPDVASPFRPPADGSILQELREGGFTDILSEAEIVEEPSSKQVIQQEFIRSAKEYEEGGMKYEEMGLYENAAVNYAAAVMATFLAHEQASAATTAAVTLSRYAKGGDSRIYGHAVFHATRDFLKAVLTSDFVGYMRVDEILRNNSAIAYDEDKEIFRRALNQGRRYIQGK